MLGEDLADKPHMTEGVQQRTLEHALDRFWSTDFVLVFLDWTVLNRTGRQSLPVYGDGVVDKEFDSDDCESHGGWAARAVRGRFVGEEKLGAINRKPSDDVSSVQTPEELRAECGPIEGDRSVSVAYG
jgi:hypothetical protein